MSRPRLYRALGIYQEYGQLAADVGGLEDALRDEEPDDREARVALRRVVAGIHRVIREETTAKREAS